MQYIYYKGAWQVENHFSADKKIYLQINDYKSILDRYITNGLATIGLKIDRYAMHYGMYSRYLASVSWCVKHSSSTDLYMFVEKINKWKKKKLNLSQSGRLSMFGFQCFVWLLF